MASPPLLPSPESVDAFIRNWTTLARPPMVPEVELYLAADPILLWEASEVFLGRPRLEPPFWGFAWAGGQAVARHLLDNPDLCAGRSVLDFAAGCGIGAIAAALAGAARVEASEIDPLAARAVALNAAHNAVSVSVAEGDLLTAEGRSWDLVIAADVCYEAPMASRTQGWLRRQATAGATVLLADPGRAYLETTGLELLGRYRVGTTLALEDRLERVTSVYRVRGGA